MPCNDSVAFLQLIVMIGGLFFSFLFYIYVNALVFCCLFVHREKIDLTVSCPKMLSISEMFAERS